MNCKLSLIILFMLVLLVGCVSQQETKVSFGEVNITVDVADEPDEWEKGLMNVDSLDQDRGMLFIFPDETEKSFWMRNTLIPLDIVFVSSDMRIVNIFPNARPCVEARCSYYNAIAKYVVEVNGNFTIENNIEIGDTIQIIPIS
ncbi:DUF192 domain-containing protein [Candidatus Aenigmatarchaeota archaeon]